MTMQSDKSGGLSTILAVQLGILAIVVIVLLHGHGHQPQRREHDRVAVLLVTQRPLHERKAHEYAQRALRLSGHRYQTLSILLGADEVIE